MNLIFLDMDGVLNCRNMIDDWLDSHKSINDKEFDEIYQENRPSGFLIDPILRKRFNEILTQVPNCRVVWSSSWRWGLRDSRLFVESFYEKCGLLSGSFLSYTPILKAGPRSEEIISWIKTFRTVKGPFEKIAIIDDDYDAEVSEYDQDRLNINCKFFKTDWETGLTEEIKNEILIYFGVN